MPDVAYIDLDARSVTSMVGYRSGLVTSFSLAFFGGKSC